MLLAVEGGGFFSSSATGYSKGLTVLLLGRKNEEKPMKVSPWNQYRLVEQETDTDLQLASSRNRVSHGCAAFICFGHTSAGLEGSSASPPKVGPVQQEDVSRDPPVSDKDEDSITDHEDDENGRKVYLKSSLKRTPDCAPIVCSDDDLRGTSGENGSDVPTYTERRKVRWTDGCGKDLVEIKEFEPSDEDTSDEEFEGENDQSCACVIM